MNLGGFIQTVKKKTALWELQTIDLYDLGNVCEAGSSQLYHYIKLLFFFKFCIITVLEKGFFFQISLVLSTALDKKKSGRKKKSRKNINNTIKVDSKLHWICVLV